MNGTSILDWCPFCTIAVLAKLKNLSGLLLSSEGMAGDNRMEMEDWEKKIIGTLTRWKIIPGQVKDFI